MTDMDDDDVDLIDEDDLLDEEDMAKPDQATLRVCGTTGKRKACKGCSCGLAEEISGGGEVTKKSVTSSCGSVSTHCVLQFTECFLALLVTLLQ